jgi:hypothetical protein
VATTYAANHTNIRLEAEYLSDWTTPVQVQVVYSIVPVRAVIVHGNVGLLRRREVTFDKLNFNVLRFFHIDLFMTLAGREEPIS